MTVVDWAVEGQGEGAAEWLCAGTHIWAAHMDTRRAVKSFLSVSKLAPTIKRIFCQGFS